MLQEYSYFVMIFISGGGSTYRFLGQGMASFYTYSDIFLLDGGTRCAGSSDGSSCPSSFTFIR